MKIKSLLLPITIIGLIGFSGCSNQLAEDVEPLASAMCKYIGIQNDLKKAVEGNDSINIHLFTAERNKLQIEMTILNREFNEKYGDKIKDQKFGKKFKREMNKAIIDCPHLSPEDRDRIKEELD